jgi:hypothetical protein
VSKQHYAHEFGLPEEQVRFFDELTPAQVEDVQRYFSAGLVGVDNYVYAVKRNGRLVWNRLKRNPWLER